MQCTDTHAKSIDYLTGSLGESERQQFDSHITSCVKCRAELSALSQTWASLRDIPAIQPNKSAMLARFEAMMAGNQSLGIRIKVWVNHHIPARAVLQAAAALFLILLGLQLGRETGSASSPEIQKLSEEVRGLRQMVALSLLQQQSASERLKGVNWSNQLDRPGDEIVSALIDTLAHDANVNVRLASIDALKRFSQLDVVRTTAVHALNTQSSPLVQMALIDFVVETEDRGALDALRRLSSDGSVNATVRARAAWGIHHLLNA